MAIVAIGTYLACNTLINAARRTALRSAARSLAELMRRVQFDSYGNSAMRGLRFFRTEAGWEYAVYEDGDGDGVLTADILSGKDLLMEGPFPLTERTSIVAIGVPSSAVRHPDTNVPFEPDMKAVNFNQSSICSFAPDGDATPGTIYLVNGNPSEAAMVRSSGEGGKIRTMFYGVNGSGWQP
jgi:hypothetical protein